MLYFGSKNTTGEDQISITENLIGRPQNADEQ